MLKKTAARSSSAHIPILRKNVSTTKSTRISTSSKDIRSGIVGSPFSKTSLASSSKQKKVSGKPSPVTRRSAGSVSASVTPRSAARSVTLSSKSVSRVSGREVPNARRKTRSTSTFKRAAKRTLRDILLSKMLHVGAKVMIIVATLAATSYGMYHVASKSFAGDVVISKSEIVARVAKLTSLPPGEPDRVVRVQEPQVLKSQNEFYQDVSEGDYIIMYPTRAIIYSLKKDRIVNSKSTLTE